MFKQRLFLSNTSNIIQLCFIFQHKNQTFYSNSQHLVDFTRMTYEVNKMLRTIRVTNDRSTQDLDICYTGSWDWFPIVCVKGILHGSGSHPTVMSSTYITESAVIDTISQLSTVKLF